MKLSLFHRRIAARNYLAGGYRYRRYESMRHDGAILSGLQEGLQYVLEPLAPQRGVAAEQGPPLEKDFYVVLFNRSAALPEESRWTRGQKQVMRRHRQLLDDLVEDKKILVATRSADDDSHTFATIGISAPAGPRPKRLLLPTRPSQPVCSVSKCCRSTNHQPQSDRQG